MATTYRAAFGNPQAHKTATDSLSNRPDTSSDAAIAQFLAEEEERLSPGRNARAASPSEIRLHVPVREGEASIQQSKTVEGSPFKQQSQSQKNGPHKNAHVSDEELAKQLQRVELASAADAAGTIPSLLFPELLNQPSSRELSLCRSLSRVQSVRASPRVATSALPPEPVVSADRQRLLTTLRQYDLLEREVAGDGNCQFRALSDQLYGTPEYHASVRQAVVNTLRDRASSYSCYVPGEYGPYCTSMAKSGTWGDHVTLQVTIAVDNTPHHPRPSRMLLSRPHLLLDLIVTCSVPILMGFMNYMASSKYFLPLSQNLSPFPLFLPTPPSFSTSTSFRVIRLPSTASTTHLPPLPPCLQAAADHFGLRIMVVTSFFESPVIYIEPAATRSPRTLYLSFWAEVHYNSLYPAQEPPPQLWTPSDPASASPSPGGGKAPKVLGSRTLGRVVQEVEKVKLPLPSLLGSRSTS
ncbi:hypothetical protein Vafri_5896 [Volvox africanus]|nr:hypothetical protein Vafri_5896 [Volvox africanus]